MPGGLDEARLSANVPQPTVEPAKVIMEPFPLRPQLVLGQPDVVKTFIMISGVELPLHLARGYRNTRTGIPEMLGLTVVTASLPWRSILDAGHARSRRGARPRAQDAGWFPAMTGALR